MRVVLVRLAGFALLAVVVVALGLGAFLVWGLPELLPQGSVILFDGERIELNQLRPATFGHWILASMGLLVAAVMVVVIVPLVIVLAVVLPLIAGAFGMAVGLLALAAAMSPVILLAWWLWRRSRSPAAAPDGTTMRP
jgi:hypothetical protein